MNERIKQLYEQSMEQHVSNNSAWEELNPEKFAELIVRECADIIEQKQKEWCTTHGISEHYFQGVQDGLDLSIGTIKEHFGVEE